MVSPGRSGDPSLAGTMKMSPTNGDAGRPRKSGGGGRLLAENLRRASPGNGRRADSVAHRPGHAIKPTGHVIETPSTPQQAKRQLGSGRIRCRHQGTENFHLRGRSATLAGKPDLITQRDGQAVIVDVKNGQDSASHAVQVMIYLYAIPRTLERYRTLKLRGQATYQDHTVRIPAEAVDDQFIQNLGALIRRLAADKPTARVPSRQQCRFCDISAADCPEHMNTDTEPREGTTLDFSGALPRAVPEDERRHFPPGPCRHRKQP